MRATVTDTETPTGNAIPGPEVVLFEVPESAPVVVDVEVVEGVVLVVVCEVTVPLDAALLVVEVEEIPVAKLYPFTGMAYIDRVVLPTVIDVDLAVVPMMVTRLRV